MKKILLFGLLTALGFSSFAQTKVGETTYDLQTNVANCRRVATNAAGDISISYTRSNQNSSWSDRGTGYNYSSDDGATWSETAWPTPFVRPDSTRVGWPNVIYTATKEVMSSHLSGGTPAGGVQILRRDIGTGVWDKQVLTTQDDATWTRMASSGDSIVVIYGLFSTVQPGLTAGGMGMYTSTDGGDTWDGPVDVPMVNSTNFLRVGGDVYSIDMNSNGKIAIALGTYQVEVLTSTDFGASFSKQTVVEVIDLDGNPNPLFDGQSGESMILTEGGDGAYSVIVDDNDLVHLWFGRYQFQKEETTTTGVNFFPASVGLVYWNETMTEGKILHETRLAAQQVGLPNPLFTGQYFDGTSGWGAQLDLYRPNLVSMPSGGYDTNGNIFVAYSSIKPATFTDITDLSSTDNVDADGFHFRDVYMIKSSDNGLTWEGPINVSNEAIRECVYPGVPRKVFGTDIPLIWQEDDGVGVSIQAPTGVTIPSTINDIMFTNVDIASIVTPADITAPTLSLNEATEFSIETTLGCLIDLNSILSKDDVPMGPDSVNYQIVDSSILNTAGVHTVEIYVLDDAGNSSDTVEITLTLEPGPSASLIGPDSLDVLLGSTYSDPGLEFVASNCIPEVAPVITNNVNELVLGTYTYEYTYTDYQGNAVTIIRYVTVITTDETNPVITLEGNSSVTVEACSGYNEDGFSAFDNIDYDVTGNVSIDDSSVDFDMPGTYTISYSVTDANGNEGTEERTIIVEDTQAPVISFGSTPNPYFVELGEAYVEPVDVSETDCDLNATLTNDASTIVDVDAIGSYVVTYTATDASSNVSTKQLNVVVGNSSILAVNKLNAVVDVYPNPSNGIININIEDELTNVEVTITNLIGEVISTKLIKNTRNNKLTSFNLGNDAAGIYVVSISTEKATLSKKVIIK